ncbi:MAG TPA: sensor histidine kinase [Opitutaceae bacterium]|jgi:signal transduction histidine kinase|nr:sensor histidine kinase [Opitutaceae bacterium]
MRNLLRILAVALVSLLVFIAAVLTAQVWLERQAQQLRLETIATKQAELVTALALTGRPVDTWDQDALQRLGQLLGAEVKFYADAAPRAAIPASRFDFGFSYHPNPSSTLVLTFPTSRTSHLLTLYQRALMMLLLLALALFLLTAGIAIVGWLRPADTRLDRDSLAAARSELQSFAHLAEASAVQSTALVHERGERQRAEEDSHLRQKLLGRAQEEKVQLGRDLHDGLIQSLYATGLTLESARALVRTNGPAAERRLTQALEALNTAIRDVRNYIQGLAPERLQRTGFAQALQALADELCAGREVKFDIQLDDEAASLLNADQTADSLQIAREAISNSLRHGHATLVTLRLHRGEREVCLLVQDNGNGFDPSERTGTGHGTNNMQARAARLGAELRVTSRPNAGTRVLVNIPFLQTA